MQDAGEVRQWSFVLVEERLVEAVLLWRRSPGGGKWPYASDAPWYLIQAEAGDWGKVGLGETGSDVPIGRRSLSRAEVAQRDEASDWIGRWVPERDRRLVATALGWKASDRQVPWRRLVRDMGLRMGAGGLQRRYERAITCIVKALDMAARHGVAGHPAQEMADLPVRTLSSPE
jgi:hypothetical protein